ncbi:cold regulated membrane protein [Corchorus olitorius]|uniref:Cold regulated membrane protein n=1 Tax=Corchorus olitorius TaxID=93759 RepID=A0A1R3IJU6_9ROSI|nr:cold regulated membrane protein [Corchorus olitorius]
MVTFSISPTPATATQSLCYLKAGNAPLLSLRNAPFQATTKLSTLALAHSSSSSISFNPLRVLLLAKGTAIQKTFLVPLFALQAPSSIISWMKSEYGLWAAFLALLIRLFFYIPAELELPFMALLLVIVAPYQVMSLRGTQQGAIISLAIAAYLAFQHFSRAGSLQKAFDQGSIIATTAIVCITAVSCLLLI